MAIMQVDNAELEAVAYHVAHATRTLPGKAQAIMADLAALGNSAVDVILNPDGSMTCLASAALLDMLRGHGL